MSVGDVTQGYRAETVDALFDGEPGGYLMVESAVGPVLWIKDPAGNVGRCSKHKVTVHDDGTVTVSPSILDTGPSGGWHGFLERGVWREV